MIEIATLARIPFLENASLAARRELAARAVLRRFAAGEVLFTAGSVSRGLYAILAGRVRVLRISDSRQHLVHVEGPGGSLGEVPLFQGGSYPATAIAAEPTTCVILSRAAVHAAMAADPALALIFLSRMASRVRDLVERLDGVVSRNVASRLAALLLERSNESGDAVFTLGGTQTEVAEELGTVREVIVRELRALRKCGAIAPAGRGRFRIPNLQALRRLRGGDPLSGESDG
ncbi:MAG: Crp/Fnr family transcriptional regulator [Gemmatimonadaceae bacterium]|nr:Crp/Fnr family transcriptional regulator [Gemmatimonadaceae bacterium]